MTYEVKNNNIRAWVSDTREIISLDAGIVVNVEQIGSRYNGIFKERSEGSLALGTLEDGTRIEIQKINLREV